MPRLSLSTWLTAFILGTVLVATAVVGAGGLGLLRELAADQAIARVRLAATGVQQAIERDRERLLSSARLLAERPTLARLLAAGDDRALRDYLAVFQRSSQLAGCAVFADGRVRAASGALPWDEIASRGPGEGWFLLSPAGASWLILGAGAGIPEAGDAGVRVVRLLNPAYARATADKVGLPVEIFRHLPPEDPAEPERARLRAGAMAEDGPRADHLAGLERFVAVLPLHDPGGRVVGGVETSLAARSIAGSLDELAGELLLLTLTVGIAATIFSLALARRVAQPVETLTATAARIGLGDLSSPVPRVRGLETGTLAAAMEEMRIRIQRLTTELEHRKAQAEAILAGIAEGVFAVDRERRLRYLNPQAAALLGVDAEEVLGRFCGDVLQPRSATGARPCDGDCPILHARFRGSAQATEHLLLPGGGRHSVVITSAESGAAEKNAAEQPHQFQVLRDETEVEATRRLRDAVLDNISHEFRSPLSAQLASIELLRDQLAELGRDDVLGLVLSLERGTLRLTRLIDNLLESTRIEAGEDTLRRRQVALDEVVEEAVGLMAPLIDQRHQELEIRLPHPLPPIIGDGLRLTQVLVNLLANANKFAPAATAIRVGGEVGKDEVTLWVDDQGPGLPPGTAEALFERFMRAPGEEPEQRGMGLGLWIVKSIVERHGGRVEARSRSRGTRMCIVLPLPSHDQDRPDHHEDSGS